MLSIWTAKNAHDLVAALRPYLKRDVKVVVAPAREGEDIRFSIVPDCVGQCEAYRKTVEIDKSFEDGEEN